MTWLNDAEVKTVEDKQVEALASLKQSLTSAVQKHMDDTAQERNFDDILSLCTYATSAKPKFKAEGQAGVEWRDEVWLYCYSELDKVLSGERETPTAQELIDELPVFTWPEVT